MMAGFDLHSVCARCRDKKKGKDPCVEKPDTLAALRTAPLHIPTLFPDSVIKQAKEDIASFDKGRSIKRVATTLMNVQRASWITENRTGRLGRTFHLATTRGVKGSTSTHPDLPRPSSLINDGQ